MALHVYCFQKYEKIQRLIFKKIDIICEIS